MSKLIQMRNRIKTIETIRKITHAMRLVSMSTHSRLKNKQESLTIYLDTLSTLVAKVQHIVPTWTHPVMNPTTEPNHNPLIIFIGSQKGLCGNFNTQLFKVLTEYLKAHKDVAYQCIGIGKKTVDFLHKHHPDTLIKSFNLFTARNFLSIAQEITDTIMKADPAYSSVVILSNTFKSFFIQEPKVTSLIPFDPQSITSEAQPPKEGYLWDQQPEEVLNFIMQQFLGARIQYLMFQSLLSEHAARFISMDNSTRNANNLLETTKLSYNKLRQAKITTELTELTGNF